MRIQDIITTKRDSGALTDEQIHFFIDAYTKGTMADYQASALLMAIYLRGMGDRETATLTAAMAASGEQLNLSVLPAGSLTIDKHSTGGVGDKTSLVVVPILAAAGAFVCKMSGRGLGHTGGTLDKLESIPGFRVGLSPQEMLAQVATVGACLAGQTETIAPADKKLYALRDATATVGSLPLIVSSILSKKLAGGANHLLFDVKVGNGALLKTPEEARELAQALVNGAKANGRKAVAVLSDMNQPLGRNIGNTLEVLEAIAVLLPNSAHAVDKRFRELCVFLANEGLKMIGLPPHAEELINNGAALTKFREIISAQGGDVTTMTNPEQWLSGTRFYDIPFDQEGYISSIDTTALGNIVVQLGGGRTRKEDTIDSRVGLAVLSGIGSRVEAGKVFCRVRTANQEAAEAVIDSIGAAFTISPDPVSVPPLIHEVIYSD
jgi:pyrimidine-nucleoside phosphorylase